MHKIPDKRAQSIYNYVRPTTKRGLRSFLGSVSYYRQFLDKLATHMAVLSPATAKSAPPKVVWSKDREEGFTSICKYIAVSCTLIIPLPTDQFSIDTDTSGLGIGGVLQVRREENWQAVAYFSWQTRGAETRYSVTKLEALAVVETIMHFSHYLYGKMFSVYTDHRPLCHLMTSTKLNGRLRRFAMKLQPWLLDIQYVTGESNTMPDALSRQEWDRQTDRLAEETDLLPKKHRWMWRLSPTIKQGEDKTSIESRGSTAANRMQEDSQTWKRTQSRGTRSHSVGRSGYSFTVRLSIHSCTLSNCCALGRSSLYRLLPTSYFWD